VGTQLLIYIYIYIYIYINNQGPILFHAIVLTKEPDWAKGLTAKEQTMGYHWESMPMFDRLAMHILHEKLRTNITFLEVSYCV
jgi:hypothetical protein